MITGIMTFAVCYGNVELVRQPMAAPATDIVTSAVRLCLITRAAGSGDEIFPERWRWQFVDQQVSNMIGGSLQHPSLKEGVPAPLPNVLSAISRFWDGCWRAKRRKPEALTLHTMMHIGRVH
jgi:hypothetical protein